MDTEIKMLSGGDIDDFTKLLDVFTDVFEMKHFAKPGRIYLQKVLTNPRFLVLVAKENDKVVGGLTVYILEQYYYEKPLAYIYDLAVLKDFQRKGIGRKLIKYLVNYCKENDFEEIFVQADKVDDYALDFYRKTNPTNEEEVIHFCYLLQEPVK